MRVLGISLATRQIPPSTRARTSPPFDGAMAPPRPIAVRRGAMNAIADMTATRTAVLDDAHAGHIHGAFGTIRQGDHGPRESWKHRLQTLLAILGPGLIVMVGDNDAGAFGTYT